MVFRTDDSDGVIASTNHMVGIYENLPIELGFQLVQGLQITVSLCLGLTDVVAVVVVAKDGIDTVVCLESAKSGFIRQGFFCFVIHEVACKENHIALLVVDEVDDGFNVLFVSIVERAEVDVRKESDAVSVEFFWKIAEIEHLLVHHEAAAPFEKAITKDDDGAKGECHGKDAKITTNRWLPASNGNTDAISDGEKHLRYRDEEEDEYEKPYRSLMIGTHVVGAIDDEEIKEKENGWEQKNERRNGEEGGLAQVLPRESCLQTGEGVLLCFFVRQGAGVIRRKTVGFRV